MKKDRQEPHIENVYQLEGRVPVAKAIPFGLQHVLAMFVANIAPLIIIASVAVYNGQPFSVIETARLLQNCMLIAVSAPCSSFILCGRSAPACPLSWA